MPGCNLLFEELERIWILTLSYNFLGLIYLQSGIVYLMWSAGSSSQHLKYQVPNNYEGIQTITKPCFERGLVKTYQVSIYQKQRVSFFSSKHETIFFGYDYKKNY